MVGGCTCTPETSGPTGGGDAANAAAVTVGSTETAPINQGNAASEQGGGVGSAPAAANGSTAAGHHPAAYGAAATTSLSLPGDYPRPIVGQAIRLDKPVQEPQPGYLIIPDDKPADEFMSGLPPTGEWKSFVMAGTSLSDKGLVFFPRFPAVHTLDASDTRVTDEGCRHLGRAQALQTLSLRNTQVTDAGLKFLKQIKTLQSVDLTGTQVTDQGVVILQQAVPGLEVKR